MRTAGWSPVMAPTLAVQSSSHGLWCRPNLPADKCQQMFKYFLGKWGKLYLCYFWLPGENDT
jgi:hypothetical protein